MTSLTSAQRKALREFAKWGEYSPDMEDIVGCYGAAFDGVVSALERKGFITFAFGGCDLTEAGRLALGESK